ncbi:MAG: hypothetical protein AAF647_05585 [Pseudomonadota bacterium]
MTQRLTRESSALEEFETPRVMHLGPTAGKLNDLYFAGSVFGCSPAFRALLEAFEPGMHALWPLLLTSRWSKRRGIEGFALKPGRWLSSVDLERSDPEALDLKHENFASMHPKREHMKRVFLRRGAFGGRHLWVEH